MFLLEPQETAFDLRWRMFGIPVRVHPMFWLVSLLMSGRAFEAGVQYLLAWVGCVFVSILIHELGHVVMGAAFGAHGRIVLYSFGGLAIGSNALAQRWQRVAVSLAGPGAGFLFLGAIVGVLWLRSGATPGACVELLKLSLGLPLPEDADVHALVQLIGSLHPLELVIVNDLVFINLVWGLVNLLPIWPLDGGQVTRNVCEGLSAERGLNVSLGVSLVTAGLLTLHCVLALNGRPLLPVPVGSVYTAVMFGLLALQSFQLLQQAHAESRWADDHRDEGRW